MLCGVVWCCQENVLHVGARDKNLDLPISLPTQTTKMAHDTAFKVMVAELLHDVCKRMSTNELSG